MTNDERRLAKLRRQADYRKLAIKQYEEQLQALEDEIRELEESITAQKASREAHPTSQP